METPILLTLESDRSLDQVADLSRQLANDLRGQFDLTAEPVTRSSAPGEKSVDVPLLGQLAITFLSGGAAVALINCLKAYIERDRSLRFKLKREDGTELELEAKDVKGATVDQTLEALHRFVGPSEPAG